MTSRTSIASAVAALALSLGAGAGWAQTSSAAAGGGNTSASGAATAPAAQPGAGTRNSPTGKSEQVAKGDRKFIEEAAGSGMFEVQAGQLAASKASDDQVKSFANMLVEHHSAANNELTQLANTKGVELPAAPPRAMRNDVEKMGKKSGQEFDKDFVKNVGINAHEKDIKLFQKASKDVKDPQLKAFVDKTLPVLQQHLAQAQKLPQAGGKASADAARMGNTGGGAATGSGGANGANKTGS